MGEAFLEGILTLLFGFAIDSIALMSGMRIPTEWPLLEDFVTASRAANSVADHVFDFQFLGVDDHTLRVTLYGHHITLPREPHISSFVGVASRDDRESDTAL
jgi:hypothetical protein